MLVLGLEHSSFICRTHKLQEAYFMQKILLQSFNVLLVFRFIQQCMYTVYSGLLRMMTCSLLGWCHCFKETTALKTEAIFSSEMFVTTNNTLQCHNQS